ncbi:holin family protein [Albidovulum sediminis]|uniref:Holin family protein n=1 Tax=Albidovulum sediminis TaxID=3066345 RepID=A0ABT2NI81_9RHOB|nr:holin family protein [Defluviimonas sediminis]MCT8328630.1 holin family protein [Defluviimonas sediminis]
MGLISRLIGAPAATSALGQAVVDVAGAFTPNATRRMEAAQAAYIAALDEFGAEFQFVRAGPFDRFVNGLNRLPRPMLAFGTLGLFVYAMVDPEGFARRMVGLEHVPEPLWWLLAAIVGFYFGAREAHHFRSRAAPSPTATPTAPAEAQEAAPRANPALEEWRRGRAEDRSREQGRDR